ncbi:unnamed protein product [Cyprideis torosa]|uniref:Uncharacterized protein n=1 Tax=Cyprideis torosa TaxID=163714 RepID=A0A7R8ZWX1_9CRUS|nr:unnamed protein product [Cyprideis torosa]CAG0906147.1 unnamed protein product [Cyprideis torosa]
MISYDEFVRLLRLTWDNIKFWVLFISVGSFCIVYGSIRYSLTKYVIWMKYGDRVTLMRSMDAAWFLPNGDRNIRPYIHSVGIIEGKPDLQSFKAPDTNPFMVGLGRMGPLRRVTWSKPIPTEKIKTVCKTFGGSSIDVLLCASAGALRRVLAQDKGNPDRCTFSVAIPATLKVPDEDPLMENYVVPIRFPLQAGIYSKSLKKRFECIKAEGKQFREYPDRFGIAILFNLINFLPMSLVENYLVHQYVGLIFSYMSAQTRQIHFLSKHPVHRYMFWLSIVGTSGKNILIQHR